MKKLIILLSILILLSTSASSADIPGQVFLPLVSNGQTPPTPDSTLQIAGQPRLVDAIATQDGRLVLVTINGANITVYLYESTGGYNLVDGYMLSEPPTRIELRGCLWIVSENSIAIDVHKVYTLPPDIVCEK